MTPIWKTMKTHWKALLASVIRAKNTAPEEKPADRSNAVRSAGSGEKKVQSAYLANASKSCTNSEDEFLWKTVLYISATKRLLCSMFQDQHDWSAFAPLESNWKTMKSASGKRPPDEATSPSAKLQLFVQRVPICFSGLSQMFEVFTTIFIKCRKMISSAKSTFQSKIDFRRLQFFTIFAVGVVQNVRYLADLGWSGVPGRFENCP